MRTLLFIVGHISILGVVFCQCSSPAMPRQDRINGICFVAPNHPVDTSHIMPIRRVNANWIAVTPYAFTRPNDPSITFDHPRQWHGERTEGTIQTLTKAREVGLKVMLKPHIWVRGQGWAGEYNLDSEEKWKTWEEQYTHYIMTFARIADSMNVEMLCIGTEYKIAVQQRPNYWRNLIDSIKTVYNGQLTYAANWDNYERVEFWDMLDYIGIDAYFPLDTAKNPAMNTLIKKWAPIKKSLKNWSDKHQKPILFTEYGYRSMDYTAAGHWQMDNQQAVPNMTGQQQALKALWTTFWSEKWFAGGFLWKWHARHYKAGGTTDSHYTPQNKPAETAVKQWYGQLP